VGRRELLSSAAARASDTARREFSFDRYGKAITDVYTNLVTR
jgi:hypothetical protein